MNNDSDLLVISDYLNATLSSHQGASSLLPTQASDVIQKISDGVLLCFLINCLSKKGPIIQEATLKVQRPTIFHKLDHANKAIDGAKQIGLEIVNVRAESIVEMKESVVIGFMNQIIHQSPKQKIEKAPVRPQEKPHQHVPAPAKREEQYVPAPAKKEEQYIPAPAKREEQYVPAPAKEEEGGPEAALRKIRETRINGKPQYMEAQGERGYKMEEAGGAQVLVLNGSLRDFSLNKGLVSVVGQIKGQRFFEDMHFHTPDLGLLPLFNPDLEIQNQQPKVVNDLRSMCHRSHAILISTPEYNGSVSPVIINALTWLARTSHSPLPNKKVAVLSTSFLTEQAIQDISIFGEGLSMNIMRNGFYVSLKKGASDVETGDLKNGWERDRLAMWYQDFSDFVMSRQPRPRFVFA